MSELWYAARVKLVPVPFPFRLAIDQAGGTLPASYRFATHNLAAQGYEVYCPFFPIDVIRRGEKMRVASALFPNYLFVAFDPETMAWRAINETRGVRHLLPMHDEVPVAVPTAFIDRIRENETLMAAVKTTKLFAENEVVRILSGSMENRVGIVEQSRRKSTRVRLYMFGGREVPAIVSTSDLIAEKEEPCPP